MAKQKKKRNKVYQGADAKAQRPTITRMSASNRSKLQQWWFEKRRIAKPALTVSAIVVVVLWLLFELVRLTTGL